MTTKDKEIENKAFLGFQNRFRGLVAEFKSRKFVKERKILPARVFRSGLRNLLLDARAHLQTSQFAPFIGWTRTQIQQQLPELAHLQIGYDELAGIYTAAPIVSLEVELQWVA